MFKLVDIQESFPNLNDIDGFTKLFKKSPSAFAEARGSLVHNVWVLPGHIIVSLDEGQKLIAYDLLPKQNPWPIAHDFMSASHDGRRKGQRHIVLDVFCAESADALHMFIVLKSARVHVWRFVRPSFEWSFLTKFELSVSKNVQVTSVCFDRKSKLLFWCERRTSTQCFVCKGRISMVGGKDMIVEKADILHNCPPVHLFLVGSSGVLLHPTANSPAGLTMYWSSVLNRIQLHLWNYLQNGVIPGYFSTDFQSLVTESVSLWINQNPNHPTAVAYCTHPVTQELIVLESTCNLYSSKIDANGKPVVSKLCRIGKASIGEINPRKACEIFAFKRFLGLIIEEHDLLVFETYTGRLVWQSDFPKSERVKAWVSQSNIPQVGLWCASFMNVIRSESIIKQAEMMLKLDMKKPVPENVRKVSKEYTLHLTFKGNNGKYGKETYVVVDNEKESPEYESSGQQVAEANVGHTISESIMLISEYLRDWDTKNLSSEVCLWLLNHPKLHGDIAWLQFQDQQQFKQFYSMFENPCLPLALLHRNRKYKLAVDEIMINFNRKSSGKELCDLSQNLHSLISRYCSLSSDIQSILDSNQPEATCNSPSTEFAMTESLKSQIMNESLTKQDLNDIIQWTAEMRPLQFIKEIVEILRLDEDYVGEENCMEGHIPSATELSTQLWRSILRKDVKLFETICTTFWEHAPHFLVRFVKLAHNFATISESSGFLQMSRRPSLVSMVGITQRAVDSVSHTSCKQDIEVERLQVLVELKLLPGTAAAMINACKLLLENDLFDRAIDLLDNSVLKETVHDRAFYMIITQLIEKGLLGRFSQRLSTKIPSNFKADDLCNLMKAFEDSTNPTEVFASDAKATALGDLEPLLTKLLMETVDK